MKESFIEGLFPIAVYRNNINRNFNCTIEFDDYIRNKKENDYQSLHQNIYYNDLPIEIQIRNKEMDYVANYGKAKK